MLRWLAGAEEIGEQYLLKVALAELEEGEPRPTEHDAVRWLNANELHDIAWLDADRPFLAELSHHLPTLGP